MFVKNIDTLDETARTTVVGEPKTPMTKLPFWSSVAEAYRSTFRNLGVLFRISWAWIFLLAYAGAMYAVAQAVGITTMPGNGATEKGLLIGLAFIVWIASSIASASIAVAWHRYLLRNERPAALVHLAAGRNVWVYIGYGLMIGLLTYGILLLLLIPIGLAVLAFGPIGHVLTIIAIVAFSLVIMRTMVVLPAKALGQATTIRQAFNATRSNSWRLFWGMFALSLPFGLVLSALTHFGLATGGALAVLLGIAAVVLYVLQYAAIMSFISISYRFFFENNAAPQSTPAIA